MFNQDLFHQIVNLNSTMRSWNGRSTLTVLILYISVVFLEVSVIGERFTAKYTGTYQTRENSVYVESTRCLKPGGWVQNLEFSVEFKCDDGSFDEDSILYKWGKLFIEGGEKMGREFNIIEHSRQYMADAGYVEIQEKKFKLPVGPWSSDRKMKEIGAWNHHYMLQGLEGMCLFLFTKVLGVSSSRLL